MTNQTKHFRLLDRDVPLTERSVSYLINGMVENSGYGIILGDSAVGKTQLAMRIAASIATESDVAIFDYKECNISPELMPPLTGLTMKKGATLFITAEDQENIVNRLLATESLLSDPERSSLPLGQLPIIPVAIDDMRLTEAEQIEELYDLVQFQILRHTARGYPLSLIIFDTLPASFQLTDESNNNEMQRMANALNAYSRKFGCTVLVTAHPPKSTNRKDGYSRGASTLINSAKFVWELKGNGKKLRTVSIRKVKNGPTENAVGTFEIRNMEGIPVFIPTNTESKVSKNKKRERPKKKYQMYVLEILKKAEDNTLSAEAIMEDLVKINDTNALRGEVASMANTLKKRMRESLTELIDENLIVKLDDGQYRLVLCEN